MATYEQIFAIALANEMHAAAAFEAAEARVLQHAVHEMHIAPAAGIEHAVREAGLEKPHVAFELRAVEQHVAQAAAAQVKAQPAGVREICVGQLCAGQRGVGVAPAHGNGLGHQRQTAKVQPTFWGAAEGRVRQLVGVTQHGPDGALGFAERLPACLQLVLAHGSP